MTRKVLVTMFAMTASPFIWGCGSAEFSGGSSKNRNKSSNHKQAGTDSPPTVYDVPQDNQESSARAPHPSDQIALFGGDKIFHIGDDRFSDTTCKAEVTSLSQTGSRYIFEFETLEPAAELSVTIEKICGVDTGDSNFVWIETPEVADQRTIAVGATSHVLRATAVAAGVARVVVESRTGTEVEDIDPNDKDNFLVGLVRVESDKKIRVVGVRTEN